MTGDQLPVTSDREAVAGGGGTQIELIRRISTDLFGIRIKIRANQLNPRYTRSISVTGYRSPVTTLQIQPITTFAVTAPIAIGDWSP